MKKVLFVMVLVLSVLAVNAQTTTTKTTKTTTSTKPVNASVKVADLPKSVTDNIAKDYPDYTVKQATSVTASNSTTYQVVVMKGTSTETLVYDKDGKFLKKLSAKSSMHHKKK
jgi:sensor histidine kinase regulating citrate/malate metabolism